MIERIKWEKYEIRFRARRMADFDNGVANNIDRWTDRLIDRWIEHYLFVRCNIYDENQEENFIIIFL